MNAFTMPDLFKKSKAEWLDGARTTAVTLLRQKHSITIEDVLEVYKLPKYLHHNTIGGVFQDDRFVSLGFTTSRRPISHGRAIRMWRLNRKYVVRDDSE